MKFFASQGLVGDISDVWQNLTGMPDAIKAASTGDDGKQYFVPLDNYPWAVFYRPSVFQAKGYQPPKTLDDLVTLSTQMQKDGLVPIAFADKDGWPAMGTFDQLNLRINGYDFHVSLMAGKEAWDSDKVKKVFDTWNRLLPFHQTNSLGRTWQEAAQSLQQKKAGMYVLGQFVGEQFTKGADQDDLDFFPFPEVDSTVGTSAVEAPIDGFMMAANPKNEAAAKKFLGYLGTPAAEGTYVKTDPTVIAVNTGADTSGYTNLQKKAVQYVSGAKQISQFLDRDTRPDFASTVMIPALQQFIKSPPTSTASRRTSRARRSRSSHPDGRLLMTAQPTTAPRPDTGSGGAPPLHGASQRGWKVRKLSGLDLVVVSLMTIIPTLFVLALVWFPAVASVALSFTNWNGIGSLSKIQGVGFTNYVNVATNYPPFWPALRHNLAFLLVLFLIATPIGMFLAVLLDKEMRFSRFYQTAIYLPVVLSLALVAFIWQLIYSHDQGLLNAVLGTAVDWYGDQNYNLWAALVATSWRHIGYIMLLYLAGLKAVDGTLREAAAIDGASEVQTFFRIIFPVMRPINVIVPVVTVIESLRAFDLVWVINKGRNGLELIATLVTANVVGEASRIGFGSAMATIMLLISSVFVAVYVSIVMREDPQK